MELDGNDCIIIIRSPEGDLVHMTLAELGMKEGHWLSFYFDTFDPDTGQREPRHHRNIHVTSGMSVVW